MNGKRAISRRRPVTAETQYGPGVVQVRLICPPQAMDAAVAELAGRFGDAWHPVARKPSRHGNGQVIQYGTLIVAVEREDRKPG